MHFKVEIGHADPQLRHPLEQTLLRVGYRLVVDEGAHFLQKNASRPPAVMLPIF